MKLYGYDWISLPLVYTQVLMTYCLEIVTDGLAVGMIISFHFEQ